MSTSPAQVQASETPILDRISAVPAPAGTRKPNNAASLIFSLAVCFLVCLVATGNAEFLDSFGPWIARNIQAAFLGKWVGIRLVLTAFGIVLAWFSAVVLHELGHLVAGLVMGFRFELMQAGHIQIDSSFRISRVRFRENGRLGAVRFHPEAMKGRPWRCAFMMFAGSFINLVFGFAALSLPYQKSLVMGTLIFRSICLGIWNLTPWQPDGKHLLDIFFNRRRHEATIAIAQLYQQLKEGADNEQLDPKLIAEAASLQEKSVRTALGNLLAFARFLDKRDYSNAALSLEVCLRFSPWARNLMPLLICNAAILQAKRGRIDQAELWLRDIPPTVKPLSRLEAEGAVLEARGDFKAALRKIAESEMRVSEDLQSESLRTSVLRSLNSRKTELEQKLAAVSA